MRKPVYSDYDKVIKVLSVMEYGKPVTAVGVCQQVGFKLVDVIRVFNVLDSMGVVQRLTSGNGSNSCYRLLVREYMEIVEDYFAEEEEEEDGHEGGEAGYKFRPQATAGTKPISLPLRAQPGFGGGRQPHQGGTGRVTSFNNEQQHAKPEWRGQQRGTHQSQGPRNDSGFLKSQTQQAVPAEPQAQAPVITGTIQTSSSNEVPINEVRERLGIDAGTRLITILSPRPTHDVWATCSALVNSGGGVLILGMRQYGEGESATFFIKTVNNPDEAIRNILIGFNDKDIISDCPKNPSFIEKVDFGNKTVLVFRLSPELFNNAPLYLARDSYGMRTNQGCYIYNNGKLERATQEKVREMWEQKRLGRDAADWEQVGEIIQIDFNKNKQSHKTSDEDADVVKNPAINTELKVTSSNIITNKKSAPDTVSQNIPQPQPSDMLTQQPKRRGRPPKNANAQISAWPQNHTHEQLQFGLSSAGNANTAPAITTVKETTTAAMPPLLSEADRPLLDSIAAPAIQHDRLPNIRLCEIAGKLLTHARMNASELSILLNRKPQAIKANVIAKLKLDPRFHSNGNTFYMDAE